jgi:hypothetical protein
MRLDRHYSALYLWRHKFLFMQKSENRQAQKFALENSIRPVALGRKNYLFAGSHEGARRAAIMYSFLGTVE